MGIKDKLDDVELDDDVKYDELYNEINDRTRNLNAVFIKDYEQNMNPRLKKYQYLFIDNIDNDTLNKSRYEYLNNIKNFLDDDDEDSEDDVYFSYNI